MRPLTSQPAQSIQRSMLKPRLESSNAYTLAPREFNEAIIELLQAEFETKASQGTFTAEFRIFPGELILWVGYLKEHSLSPLNFAFSKNREEEDTPKSTVRIANEMTTMAREVFAYHFENIVREELPFEWSKFMNNEAIYYIYDPTNRDLEFQADKLLGISDPNSDSDLIKGDSDFTQAIEEVVELMGQEKPKFQEL